MNTEHNLLSIGKAALLLGVSIDTLRNWDADGKLSSIRLPSGQRRYLHTDIQRMKEVLSLNNLGSSKRKRVYTTSSTPLLEDLPKPLPAAEILGNDIQEIKPTYPGLSHSALTLLIIGASLLMASSVGGIVFKKQLSQQSERSQLSPVPEVDSNTSVLGITSDYLAGIEQRIYELESKGYGTYLPTKLALTAKNTVKNPSFEAANGVVPRQWSYTLDATKDSVMQTPQGIHSGFNGLKFLGNLNDGKGAYLGISQPQTITTPQRNYAYSVFLKHTNISDSARVRIGFWDAYNNKYADIKTYEISGTKDWYRIGFTTKTTGLITDHTNWYPVIEVQDLKDGVVYIDDVQLEEGSIETDFASTSAYPGFNLGAGEGAVLGAPNGDIYPAVSGYGALGKLNNRWEALYLNNAIIDKDGNLTAKNLTVSSGQSIGGDLTVNGTLNVLGNIAQIRGVSYSFPTTQGAANTVLQNDGSGNMTWTALAGGTCTDCFVDEGNSFGSLAVLGTNDSNALAFETNGTERARFDTAGNFGIGTTAPSFKLTLDQDGGIIALGSTGTGTGAVLPTFSNDNRIKMFWYPRKAAFRAGNSTTTWEDSDIGLFSAAFGSETLASGDYSFAAGDTTTASAYGAVAFGVDTEATGSYSAVIGGESNIAEGTYSLAGGYFSSTYGSSSIALGEENYAEGTASLALVGSSSAYGNYSSAIGHGVVAEGYSTMAVGSYNVFSGNNPTTWVSTDQLFVVGNGASSGSRSNALTILKNGNTGIGTTNPTARLDVRGSGSDFSSYAMRVQNASGLTALTVNDNGNVGIGTTAIPDYSLVVGGVGSFQNSVLVNAATGGQFQATNNFNFLEMSHDGAVGYIGTDYGGPGSITPLSFRVSNTEYMRIDASGNVGIGTTAPGAKLAVAGGVKIGYIGTGVTPPTNGLIVQGNVGIGTSAASERLTLEGGMLITDYVTNVRIRSTNNFSSAGSTVWIEANDTAEDNRDYKIASLRTASGSGTGSSYLVIGNQQNGGTVDHFSIMETNDVYINRNKTGSTNYGNFLVANGNVGIGTTAPISKLAIAGLGSSTGTTLVIDSNGDVWRDSSSLRYKDNVETLTSDFNKILELSPVSYTFKQNGVKTIGYIAEDLDSKGLKDLVVYDAQGRPDAIKYDRLSIYLLEILKGQQQSISQLQTLLSRQPTGEVGIDNLEQLTERVRYLEDIVRDTDVKGVATGSATIADDIDSEAKIFTNDVVAQKDLNVLGKLTTDDLGVTGSITAGLLSITGDENSSSISTLSGPLKLQELALGSLEIMAGKVIVDEKGTITLKEGDLEIEKGTIVGNDKIRGIEVEVEEGKNSIIISFPEKRQESKYAVAVSTSWETGNAVKNKTDNGFTVTFTNAAPADATFDWIVID